MERTIQMANELENMMEGGEVDLEVMNELTAIIQDLKEGKKAIIDYYRPSTPQKLLEALDEVNQRVKR